MSQAYADLSIDLYLKLKSGIISKEVYDSQRLNNKINLNPVTFSYSTSLQKLLDKKYIYNKDDFNSIINESLQNEYESTVNQTARIEYFFFYLGYCNNECVPIADGIYDKEENATGWTDAWTGCYKYCLSIQ